MEFFEKVFDRANIDNMLFFNVKSVLMYPTLSELGDNNLPMYEQWRLLSKIKYGDDSNETYLANAVNHHEFVKIVAITYATLYIENGVVKREFKMISNENEKPIIDIFMNDLTILCSNGAESCPSLCGNNIINNDIPLLIKRHLKYSILPETEKHLPLILKKSLSINSCNSGLVDIMNIWKFGGDDNISLSLISDFLGLKKTIELLSNVELSKYYWDNIDINKTKTFKFMELQSATETNLVIQIINELRQY